MGSHSDEDYPKILEFMNSIIVEGKRFRQQVLLSLAKYFKFEHSTFFLIDKNGEPVNPITLNIDERYTRSYQNYYHGTDVFSQKPAQQAFLNNNVLSITDLMSYEMFENTEYYIDFLKQQGFYHELVVALLDGDRFIGAIGLFRPFANMFNMNEINNLKIVSGSIAKALRIHLFNQTLYEQKEIYEQCNSSSPYGTVIFKSNLVINYYNPAAEEFIRDIFPKTSNPIADNLKNTVESFGPLWQYGGYKKVLSPSLKAYSLRVFPLNSKADFNHNNLYFILSIVPENTLYSPEIDVHYKFNLTSRELEILALVRKGLTNEQIADQLFIAISTVKTHLQKIFKKVNVTNRTALCHKLELISK